MNFAGIGILIPQIIVVYSKTPNPRYHFTQCSIILFSSIKVVHRWGVLSSNKVEWLQIFLGFLQNRFAPADSLCSCVLSSHLITFEQKIDLCLREPTTFSQVILSSLEFCRAMIRGWWWRQTNCNHLTDKSAKSTLGRKHEGPSSSCTALNMAKHAAAGAGHDGVLGH